MNGVVTRIYRFGQVTVTRHPLDWADRGPGFAELARTTFERFIALPRPYSGHRYLNPLFSLYAPAHVSKDVFLLQARRACAIYMRQLKSVLGYGRIRHFQKHSSAGARMLVSSGVLILDGKLAHIKRLNDVQLVSEAS